MIHGLEPASETTNKRASAINHNIKVTGMSIYIIRQMTVDSSEYHNPSAGNRIFLLSSLVAKRKYQTACLSNDFQKNLCAVLISKSIHLIIYVFNCNHLSFFKNHNESKIALPAL